MRPQNGLGPLRPLFDLGPVRPMDGLGPLGSLVGLGSMRGGPHPTNVEWPSRVLQLQHSLFSYMGSALALPTFLGAPPAPLVPE